MLSQKAIAVFGQVKVQITNTTLSNCQYVDLFSLYKNGWWITERFGTLIYLVKKKTYEKDGFCLIVKRIKTDVNLDTFDLLWQQIAERKQKQYQHILEHKNKYKKPRVNIYEDSMPTL